MKRNLVKIGDRPERILDEVIFSKINNVKCETLEFYK